MGGRKAVTTWEGRRDQAEWSGKLLVVAASGDKLEEKKQLKLIQWYGDGEAAGVGKSS